VQYIGIMKRLLPILFLVFSVGVGGQVCAGAPALTPPAYVDIA